MPSSTIFALGDIHGNTTLLQNFLQQTLPDVVLQTGDFGLSSHSVTGQYSVQHLEKLLYTLPKIPTIYWCDGNHELWRSLAQRYFHASIEQRQSGIHLTEHIVWMPRGSWLTLPDGQTVLFAGGGKSVDWKTRLKKGLLWSGYYELLLEENIQTPCPPPSMIVSHTAPRSVRLPGIDDLSEAELAQKEQLTGWDLSPDPSRDVLEILYQRHHPARWLCGHFHRHIDMMHEATHFTVLDTLSGPGQSWVQLC